MGFLGRVVRDARRHVPSVHTSEPVAPASAPGIARGGSGDMENVSAVHASSVLKSAGAQHAERHSVAASRQGNPDAPVARRTQGRAQVERQEHLQTSDQRTASRSEESERRPSSLSDPGHQTEKKDRTIKPGTADRYQAMHASEVQFSPAVSRAIPTPSPDALEPAPGQSGIERSHRVKTRGVMAGNSPVSGRGTDVATALPADMSAKTAGGTDVEAPYAGEQLIAGHTSPDDWNGMTKRTFPQEGMEPQGMMQEVPDPDAAVMESDGWDAGSEQQQGAVVFAGQSFTGEGFDAGFEPSQSAGERHSPDAGQLESSPSVHIGRVDVFVVSLPESKPVASSYDSSAGFASRHYLRRL